MDFDHKKQMISSELDYELPVSKRCELLGLNRSSHHYKRTRNSECHLQLVSATDNAVIERFWRSAKYEDVYLQRYETLSELRHSMWEYIHFYNKKYGGDDLKTHVRHIYSCTDALATLLCYSSHSHFPSIQP